MILQEQLIARDMSSNTLCQAPGKKIDLWSPYEQTLHNTSQHREIDQIII